MASKKRTAKGKRAKGKARARRAPATTAPADVIAPAVTSPPSITPSMPLTGANVSPPVATATDVHEPEPPSAARERTPPPRPPTGDPDSPTKGVQMTPMKAELSGRVNLGEHTLDSVRGYVRQDLLEASPASVEDWVDLFLGVPAATFSKFGVTDT